MGVALINGRNYSHKDTVMNLGGVPLASFSDFTIDEGAKREFSRGSGNLPVGYGEGPDDDVAFTFTISMKDEIALRRAIGDPKRLAPFDVPITFNNPSDYAGVVVKNVLILKIGKTSSVDTTDIKAQFTCIASHCDWK